MSAEKHNSNFYKFQIGTLPMKIKPDESFSAKISTEGFSVTAKIARCKFCEDILCPGHNFTVRQDMPMMCDGCFKKYGDKAMDLMNGG
jgi:RNase P subunit RPR2